MLIIETDDNPSSECSGFIETGRRLRGRQAYVPKRRIGLFFLPRRFGQRGT